MDKFIEESKEQKKRQSPCFNRKEYDYKKVDTKELTALLYNLESTFSFIKKQNKMFAHIIAYFLVVSALSFVAYFFTKQLGTIPMGIIIAVNVFILLYGVWLLLMGIKQCFINDKYLKILMSHIQDVKKVLQRKDEVN
ncbi:hypothetical protein O0Q50_20070 [Priestia aryabhattai]|uniref:Uncharacterized protein n=1 Tax=Priestia aryabhattai TaxID=412384 RepID=A0AAX6ND95_PRIAR|nr:hypothetical protein [Priestia aryabhattai]MDU9693475.1 hypothetical protein [Priestia aryabhattai]